MFVRTLLDVLFITNVFSFQGTSGGDEGSRTPDPLLARQVLSQLSYTPTYYFNIYLKHKCLGKIFSCKKYLFLKVLMNFQNRTAGNSP